MPRFEAPVGPQPERNAGAVWPSAWTDANKYEAWYEVNKGNWAYHTGADLNLKIGQDENAQVYAMGDGTIIYAGIYPDPKVWGGLVVIYHGIVDNKVLYSRYGHVKNIPPALKKGVRVAKGEQVGQIGGRELGFDPHLHFDISTTPVLDGDHRAAGFWPGRNLELVRTHFVNPLEWLHNHRHMDASSQPASADPNTAEWQVVHPDGAVVRKGPSLSAESVRTLQMGAKLTLLNAGGGFQDGYLWGQIHGGEFKGFWVAVQKEDKTIKYLSK